MTERCTPCAPGSIRAGIGHVTVGMARQGYDLQLTRYDEKGWRATFYTTGMELYDGDGTFADECDGYRLGAHAVARDAAGGVGSVDEVRGGQPMIRLAWWQPMLILAVGFFILAVAGGVLAFNEPDGFRGSPITDAEARLRRAADLRDPPTDRV